MLAIVFIHEMGHYAAASYYKWRIDSIVLWVFGGVMKTPEANNRKLSEDIVVTIAGPMQHIFIFLIILALDGLNIVPHSVISLAYYYNFLIFLFNLLPIYPLDGGKLLFYALANFFPFQKALHWTLGSSIVICVFIVLLQVFMFPFTLSAFLLIVFLLFENRREWANKYYTFIRFLLNRMKSPPPDVRTEQLIVPEHFLLMDAFSLFKRNKIHEIRTPYSEKSISEQQSLALYFKEKKWMKTVKDIMVKR